jgi:DNA repair protein RadD
MGESKIVANVVNTWLEKGEGRPTLVFGINRAHAAQLQAQFQRAGVSAGYVDCETDRVSREKLAREFRAGEIKVACSVRTLTTGVDWPVSCIVDAAPTRSEMLHVQKIGRGLRVNPGTEDCLILDHAGNALRLGLVTDIHHEKLDDGQKLKPDGDKPKAEKLPKPCINCGALHTGPKCPACGHVKTPAQIREAEGELVEITAGKVKTYTKAEKQAFWSMALWVDDERGRGGKLAKGLYKGKFGVWPRDLHDSRKAPDFAFLSYEKSRRIAYAKKMEKQRGAHNVAS